MAKEIAARERKMADYKRAKGWLCAVVSASLLAVCAAMPLPASAQDKGQQVSIAGGTIIDLKTAPEVPSVGPPAGLVTNRPTIPMADYLAAKRAAALKARQPKPAPRP